VDVGAIADASRKDGNVVIEYTGTLETSSTVNGKQSKVDGPDSPYSAGADQVSFIAESSINSVAN
jgi:hypothetical protein